MARMPEISREAVQRVGRGLGPLLALLAWLLLPEGGTDGLSPGGRATAAIAVWMACWWLTEAVPLAATALLPVVLFPLSGATSVAEATAPYANSLIFLFLGGFILGLGLQRWNVHRRLALALLARIGSGPRRLVGGFMLVSAGLSMWLSNTATVIMLLPIGLSVVVMLQERGAQEGGDAMPANLAPALMLGIAYAASIGGVGTLIGTPPNLVLAGFLRQHYGVDLTMQRWLMIGLPLVVVFLPLAWLLLTRAIFPLPPGKGAGGRAAIRQELHALGPMAHAERVVLGVFLATAACWVLRPQLAAWTGIDGLNDATIGVAGALALFVIPVDRQRRVFAMDWATARKVPWEILILFGGGLSLAAAVRANGVDAFIAGAFTGLEGVPLLLFLLLLVAVVVLLTEITSNTAVTTTLLPVLAATVAVLALPAGPVLAGAAMAASCAFMLPVATPPNAIVFASGQVTIAQMVRAGVGLNLVAIVLVSLAAWLLVPVDLIN